MKQAVQIASLALAALTLLGCGGSSEPVPTYQGKTASEWISVANDKHQPTSEEGIEALRVLAEDSEVAKEFLSEKVIDDLAKIEKKLIAAAKECETLKRYREFDFDVVGDGLKEYESIVFRPETSMDHKDEVMAVFSAAEKVMEGMAANGYYKYMTKEELEELYAARALARKSILEILESDNKEGMRIEGY